MSAVTRPTSDTDAPMASSGRRASPLAEIPEGVSEAVLVLDFGSQYAQLIARRVREAGVFSVLVRPDAPAAELAKLKPAGIIMSGGPSSVTDAGAPRCDPALLDIGVPVLGICYGMQ
ncbi:MAG: GMP synthase (glutamine-hydrolyzing), partial [Phycisphaerales bacterium]|nr:GMP synthase (glutamine-hydrolyzing) [Phycisphaerales bacterium]